MLSFLELEQTTLFEYLHNVVVNNFGGLGRIQNHNALWVLLRRFVKTIAHAALKLDAAFFDAILAFTALLGATAQSNQRVNIEQKRDLR